jgi:hypothetical protein
MGETAERFGGVVAVLTLRLKAKWWDKIASGEKTVEMRLANDYWRKRLIGRHYDEIHIWKGYPPKTDSSVAAIMEGRR